MTKDQIKFPTFVGPESNYIPNALISSFGFLYTLNNPSPYFAPTFLHVNYVQQGHQSALTQKELKQILSPEASVKPVNEYELNTKNKKGNYFVHKDRKLIDVQCDISNSLKNEYRKLIQTIPNPADPLTNQYNKLVHRINDHWESLKKELTKRVEVISL
jgi:hypothetical protein